MTIQVMKQALEEADIKCNFICYEAKIALRAAIEAAERQEPVAKWDETRGVADRLGLAKIADETLLYTTPQHAIPDGWQLVPVEPTTGMVEVAWDTIKRHGEAVILVYKRMLAAAPKEMK